MGRIAFLLGLSLSSLALPACGGGGLPNPAAPTTNPTPSPAPAVAPAAVAFPNMVGGWSGTWSVSSAVRGSGLRSSNVCTQTWIISAQSAGSFTGTFQVTGGTTCSSSGSVAGEVSTSGAISLSTVDATPQSGATICTRTAGTGIYTGVVSGGAAFTAQTSDILRCTTTILGSSLTQDADRTLLLSMNKR
jgi:hypothetical protein